jgi:hypothetical protein
MATTTQISTPDGAAGAERLLQLAEPVAGNHRVLGEPLG